MVREGLKRGGSGCLVEEVEVELLMKSCFY